MKFILLAATALIAAPVIAQTSGSAGDGSPVSGTAKMPDGPAAGTPTDQTTPPDASATDPAMTPPPADPAMGTPPADPAMGTPPADPAAPAADPAMASPPGAATTSPPMATGGDPVGGYQPTQPALSGTAAPGGPVTFQAAPAPAQAYPAPAPLAEYPVCKKGQYDKCRQRGGR